MLERWAEAVRQLRIPIYGLESWAREGAVRGFGDSHVRVRCETDAEAGAWVEVNTDAGDRHCDLASAARLALLIASLAPEALPDSKDPEQALRWKLDGRARRSGSYRAPEGRTGLRVDGRRVEFVVVRDGGHEAAVADLPAQGAHPACRLTVTAGGVDLTVLSLARIDDSEPLVVAMLGKHRAAG